MMDLFDGLFRTLALPQAGLTAIFLASLVSATLLPMGSEAVLLAYLNVAPDMLWAAVAVATLGNTLGGVITYGMGRGAEAVYEHYADPSRAGPWALRAQTWTQRWGTPVLLLSWLPVIGDPLCAVAGWLKLPFWTSVFYIAVGKCLRYMALALSVSWFFGQ
ncbi:YqaA family protein [Pusillimonas sp. T2]|uniref:YqaA family protein n=1 Tax=Pusillimonas sp. T2 TaxID=1548123 RepID=UPI0020B15DE0|nr:YqaA family protein [Pusillimonas sp. T2]